MNLSEKARQYAIECHQSTNHLYDGYLPYEFHLRLVVATAHQFIQLIPEADREIVLAGCWVHDTIEDCRQTYNDVSQALGTPVAELAYALTNEKGKNRSERANAAYYEAIKATPYATFVKLCDRIANVTYSQLFGSRMTEVYAQEYPGFREKLYDPAWQPIFAHLEGLLKN